MIDVGLAFRENAILLTGGNGFLGKVVLGLLLDRYEDFQHIYLLLRPRRSRSAGERFEELLHSPALAEIVRQRGADFIRGKITLLAGDASQPSCGLQPEEVESLRGRVRLILNCAGLVEFFPPVDESLHANVDSVENVAGLAKRIGAKLLHVSTAYVAGRADGLIEETEPIAGFYPRRRGPLDEAFHYATELRYCRGQIEQIVSTVKQDAARGDQRPRDVLEALTDLGRKRAGRWGWVNTYTYSKSLGEQILAADSGLDCAIVRPAIVESALRFPLPGWIEGGRTAAPLVLMALGGLKDWPVREDMPLEVVPVDLVAAAILVVAALLLHGRHEPVYHLATADRNPLLLGRLVRLLDSEAERMTLGGIFQGNGGTKLRNRPPIWIDPFRHVRFLTPEQARGRRVRIQGRIDRAERWIGDLQDTLSAFPGASRALGEWSRSLRTLGLQARFREQTLEQYLPFIQENRYIFEAHNIRQGYSLIRPEDRQRLPWDPERINWDNYWRENQIGGIKRWVQPEAVREWSFKI